MQPEDIRSKTKRRKKEERYKYGHGYIKVLVKYSARECFGFDCFSRMVAQKKYKKKKKKT